MEQQATACRECGESFEPGTAGRLNVDRFGTCVACENLGDVADVFVRVAQSDPSASAVATLDLIAEQMSGREWDADMCERIAAIIRASGRLIAEPGTSKDEDDEDMLPPGLYSCFVLHDNGTWAQPTYRTREPIGLADFADRVLAHYRAQHSHNYFTVQGIGEDDGCPEADATDLPEDVRAWAEGGAT